MTRLRKKVGAILAIILVIVMSISCFAFVGCGEGAVGPTGPAGAQGPAGPAGPAGAKGETGEKGETGDKGATGATGAKGDKGDRGDKGDMVYGAGGKNGDASAVFKFNPTGGNWEEGEFPEDIESFATVDEETPYTPLTEAQRGNLTTKGKFYADYATLAEAQEAAHDLGAEIAAQGMVLLKNNGALPLAKTENKVTLLGVRNARMVRSGFGSGAGGGSAVSTLLADALEMENFRVNPKPLSLYTKYMNMTVEDAILEIDPNTYGSAVTSTYKAYNDAAILVFSRTGAENFDIKTNNVAGNADKTKHGLQLDDNELKLVQQAKAANFGKVIVVINSSNIMQIPELVEPNYNGGPDYSVDAVIWAGGVGQDGCKGLVKILEGEVSPSGHTSDLWEKDFKKSPTWTNFGTNTQNYEDPANPSEATRLDTVYYAPGGTTITPFAGVEYREGIYYGYKYYETLFEDTEDDAETTNVNEKEAAYSNVLFPFGYGLSYTKFEWTVVSTNTTTKITRAADGTASQMITANVMVSNVGKVAGRDVVQAYYTPPFNKETTKIEKAAVNMATFAKTDLLQPGESQILTLSFAAQEMASFDWNDANHNGHQGYELENGGYVVSLRTDSHTVKTGYAPNPEAEGFVKAPLEMTFTVEETENGGILITHDLDTKKPIKAVYTKLKGGSGEDKYDVDYTYSYSSVNAKFMAKTISRVTGLKQPEAASKADRTLDAVTLADYESQYTYYAHQDKATDPWYVKQAITGWDQATDGTAALTKTLADMAGVPYVEPTIVDGVVTWPADMTAEQKANNAKWEEFMNQFTWAELAELPSNANNTIKRLGALGYSAGNSSTPAGPTYTYGDPDGPINAGGVQFPSNPIVTATFNTQLAEDLGTMVGNLLLLNGSAGWRGAGADIHRSPFSGRNFEYYSEDGVTAGLIGMYVTRGVTAKGIIAHFKHFFGNDQEAYRADYGGVFTWATEQTLREQTAKPFQYIITRGGSIGLMNSFNRIGKWTQSTNYATHELLLNQEWDFQGECEGDMWAKEYVPLTLGVRGGDDQLLTNDSSFAPCALERGIWNATDKCVNVATKAEQEGYKPSDNKDADGNEVEFFQAVAKGKLAGELKSYTHYFNVRKCAQRLIQSMANSACNANGLAAEEEVKYTLTKGIYNEIELGITETKDAQNKVTREARKFDSITFTNATWPKGMSFNANTGYLSGTPTEDTAADVEGVYNCDSWITRKNVTFKFAFQSDLQWNDKNIVDGGEITATAGALNATIKAEKLVYGAQLKLTSGNSTSNRRITNAYCYNGKWYHRDEDKSAADILTLGVYMDNFNETEAQLKELTTYNIYGYKVEGLPESATITYVKTDEMGWAGKSAYKVNTSVKLGGTLAAGNYNVKVTLTVPFVNKSTNPWMTPNDSCLTYVVAFTLKVA